MMTKSIVPLIVILVISACRVELANRALPVNIDGSHRINMGSYYESSNCQGMIYTSHDQSCTDTVLFSFSGRPISVDIGAFLDSEKRVTRVEMDYTMPSAVADSFMRDYRRALSRQGWELIDPTDREISTLTERKQIASDSTMSIWLSVPSKRNDDVEFMVSCFVRTNK